MATSRYEKMDPKYKEIALKELKETPDRVDAHIKSLRRWLHQCQHISGCPDDDQFLLRFLRVAKFQQEKAQSRLENYCTVRGSASRGVPYMFDFPDVKEEKVRKFLEWGFLIPLGYNKRGEYVFIARLKAWDPEEIKYEDFRCLIFMGFETLLLSDEQKTIGGIMIILDFGDVTKKASDILYQRKHAKDRFMAIQDGYAMRVKGFFIFREPLFFDILFKMFKFWVNPKLAQRLHRLGDDAKKLHEKCPDSKKLLPTEYGGEGGPLSDFIERWSSTFYEFWSQRSTSQKIQVDESKRPGDSLKYLRQYRDYPDDAFGTKGTYTPIDAM